MIVHLHTSCWNEERMLPFFFRHYDAVVDHYFFHDNESTDRSLELLAAHPRVTVRPLRLEGDSICIAAFDQLNDLWKSSRGQADWVAFCNVDEFFWHPDLRWYLEVCRERGITYLPSIGYQMVTDDFPRQGEHLPAARVAGVHHQQMDKPSFFNPDDVLESGFTMGRHTASPQGRVIVPRKTEIQLLHYKNLGLDYVTLRHAELNARRRALDIQNSWGFHYDPAVTRKRFVEWRAAAREVATPVWDEGKNLRQKRPFPEPSDLHRG